MMYTTSSYITNYLICFIHHFEGQQYLMLHCKNHHHYSNYVTLFNILAKYNCGLQFGFLAFSTSLQIGVIVQLYYQ